MKPLLLLSVLLSGDKLTIDQTLKWCQGLSDDNNKTCMSACHQGAIRKDLDDNALTKMLWCAHDCGQDHAVGYVNCKLVETKMLCPAYQGVYECPTGDTPRAP